MVTFSIVVLTLLPVVCCIEACPPWTVPGKDNLSQCVCGNDFHGVVHCNSDLEVSVLFCYCITYNRHMNQTLVGHCTASCTVGFMDSAVCRTHYRLHTNSSEMINQEVCGEFNRRGQLCGECMEGYGPPVYSYSFTCVKCRKSDFKINLIRYIAVAYIPLTAFFLIVRSLLHQIPWLFLY